MKYFAFLVALVLIGLALIKLKPHSAFVVLNKPDQGLTDAVSALGSILVITDAISFGPSCEPEISRVVSYGNLAIPLLVVHLNSENLLLSGNAARCLIRLKYQLNPAEIEMVENREQQLIASLPEGKEIITEKERRGEPPYYGVNRYAINWLRELRNTSR